MGRAFSYVAVILLALAAGYYFAIYRAAPVHVVGPIAITTPQTLEVTTVKKNESTTAYTVDAQYPQFGDAAIDSKIEKVVTDVIDEIKELPANPPDMASPQNELTIRFESPYIGPDIVSVKLITSEYTGGAHANSLFSGLNFDRASGKQLLQEDAFRMIGLSAQQVSTAATAQLKERLGDLFFAEGASSNPENFSSFLVSDDKVTFIFQPYQVAPFSEGPQEVSFERKR